MINENCGSSFRISAPRALKADYSAPTMAFSTPMRCAISLRGEVRARGGDIRQFCKLLGVMRRCGGYTLDTGKGALDCDIVVNAAGAWAPAGSGFSGRSLHIFRAA